MDTLVNCYNETLRSVLDIYAPVLTRDIIVRPRAPWFNEDIRKAKQTRRRVEKKWRTTRLPADLAAFKKERNRVVNLKNEARRVYYNQFIEDNSTDQRRLFMASKSLLNMQPDRSLPPHIDVSLLANDMGEFFITKIANIRSKLDGISPPHFPSTSEPDLVSEPSDIVLSDFQCQAVEAIRDITSGKKVISVVITNCCRNGKISRHGVMAYVHCISKLVGNISYGRCGVIQDVCYDSRMEERGWQRNNKTIVDQRNVDIGKAADAVVQTEYVYKELSTKIRSVNLFKFRRRCLLNVKQMISIVRKS